MGLQILATIVIAWLTYKTVKKKDSSPVALSVLFTTLIGLLGAKKQVMEGITSTAEKANADGFYGITGTGLGLAVLTGLLAFALKKWKAPFVLMLVATFVLLNFDVILVDITLGPINSNIEKAWDWFYPWIQQKIEDI